MPQNFTYRTNDAQPLPLSWQEGFRLYLHDPHARKLLRRFAVRFLPVATGIAVIDDFLLPGLGLIDNVTLPFLIGGIIVMLYKVNRYRYHPPAIRPVGH
jgi:hypothetical protein